MKRLAVAILLLLCAGMAVFLAGWVTLRVPAGSHAVMVTKTGGVFPVTVSSGSFVWTPEALLPTNLRLMVFSPVRLTRSVQLRGELPSAAVYSSFMAGKPDFSYDLTLSITASPDMSALPSLYEATGLSDSTMLSEWVAEEIDSMAESIRGLVTGRLASGDGNGESKADEGGGVAAFLPDEQELMSTAATLHPKLKIQNISVASARVPDMNLYHTAGALYGSYLSTYRAAVEPAMTAASAQSASDLIRLETLQKYGEMLQKFPALVDYLAIEKGLPPRGVQR